MNTLKPRVSTLESKVTTLENKPTVVSPKAYIKEIWHSGNNWYRIWSDGFIEQGGAITNDQRNSALITYHKAFSGSSYTVIAFSIPVNNTSNPEYASQTGKTNTSVRVGRPSSNSIFTVVWVASGY